MLLSRCYVTSWAYWASASSCFHIPDMQLAIAFDVSCNRYLWPCMVVAGTSVFLFDMSLSCYALAFATTWIICGNRSLVLSCKKMSTQSKWVTHSNLHLPACIYTNLSIKRHVHTIIRLCEMKVLLQQGSNTCSVCKEATAKQVADEVSCWLSPSWAQIPAASLFSFLSSATYKGLFASPVTLSSECCSLVHILSVNVTTSSLHLKVH